jgi:hypothetical protein
MPLDLGVATNPPQVSLPSSTLLPVATGRQPRRAAQKSQKPVAPVNPRGDFAPAIDDEGEHRRIDVQIDSNRQGLWLKSQDEEAEAGKARDPDERPGQRIRQSDG